MVYFSKLSARVPFLSYLTLNVVNSYMNNRDLECSGEGEGGASIFFYNIWIFGVSTLSFLKARSSFVFYVGT